MLTFAGGIGKPMRKTMSAKQLAANRRNAQKSTGPKTLNGRAVSKMNALKHGILSKEVLVRGKYARESEREFRAFQARFWEHFKPVGPVEEILVNKVVTSGWRLRRVLKAESGEIALNADRGQWHRRRCSDVSVEKWMHWLIQNDMVAKMEESEAGNFYLKWGMEEVRAAVEKEGELTSAIIQKLAKHLVDKPNTLVRELENLRLQTEQKPDRVEAADWPKARKKRVLAHLDRKLNEFDSQQSECEERDANEEEARLAADMLPSPEVLDKILRYEVQLERQWYRALIHLERVQLRRLGKAVPPPTIELLERV